MDNKPIITYAGDVKVFERLQSALEKSLSTEAAEWRRSYGRPPKMVHVKSNFVPFSSESISKQELKLAGKAVLHTYWTDCPDMDTYKSNVRECISSWLTTLRHHGISDWVVILVETSDFKKGNKLLLRTTVLDKIKTDFGQKQNDRCLSLIEPRQQEARSVESWSVLLVALRQLVLSAHGKAINKFEEGMRAQREKRNLPTWSYHNYFLLQEELARVFESLGLYDEALVQYDELDALFTQFVLNSQVGEIPGWLRSFAIECDCWMGVSLSSKNSSSQDAHRSQIQKKNITLLQFRNYLFSRQCELLILLHRPWEIAERSLLFVHNCINEVKILDVEVASGGLACWGFLSALEVTNTCNTFSSESAQVEAFSIHTAGLWDYARNKLEQLGELCGLMPEQNPNSEQLHLVVNLSAGMGVEPETANSPVHTLKEALSNKQCFQKHYLELSELAMGTFKHIGRMRSARAVGRSLAKFYIRGKEHSKALPFLTDALRDVLQQPGWDLIAGYLEVEIAHCSKAVTDQERYVRTCAEISCNTAIESEKRQKYFVALLESLADLGSKQVNVAGENMLKISQVTIPKREGPLSPGSELRATVFLNSRLPDVLLCPKIGISLECTAPTVQEPPKKVLQRVQSHYIESKTPPSIPFKRSATATGIIPETSSKPRESISLASFRLELEQQLEYKQDKSLSSASLICKNAQKLLRRKESHGNLVKEQVDKISCPLALEAENVQISPGHNQIELRCKVSEAGILKSQQLCVQISPALEMIIDAVGLLEFSVLCQQPTFALDKMENDLIAGIPQHMELKLCSGTTTVSEGTKTWLRCSKGLSMQLDGDEEMQRDLQVSIPPMGPNQTRTIPITVLATCVPQKDASTIEHKVTVVCPWTSVEKQVSVHFIPPFISVHRLHTANLRKFVAVSLHGQTRQPFKVSAPTLESEGVELKPLNPPGDHMVCIDIGVCYMWEVVLKGEETPLKFEFCVNYKFGNDTGSVERPYTCNVDIHDYTTLYTVRAKVEPGKGSEFCRAGTMCHLSIHINRVHPNSPQTALMYEVLTDQSMWAVCGRTAGVVTVEEGGKHSVVLDVMPLTGGYLPLPAIRLSKYIPADHKTDGWSGSGGGGSPNTSLPRLEPFSLGQVYNWSKAQQVHVLPGAASSSTIEVSS